MLQYPERAAASTRVAAVWPRNKGRTAMGIRRAVAVAVTACITAAVLPLAAAPPASAGSCASAAGITHGGPHRLAHGGPHWLSDVCADIRTHRGSHGCSDWLAH